jgi:hypothetical protein
MTNTIRNDVITTYKADSSQHNRTLHSLAGSEKRFADEAVASAKRRSEAWKQMGTDAAIAFGAIGAGIAIAKAGFDQFRESSKLAAATATVDLDRISKAAGGLRTNMDLMRLSSAAANGAWKLNTTQIESVIGGMRALEKQGFDNVRITERFTEVLKKGKVEGLDEFGLSIKSTGDYATDLRHFLAVLGGEVDEVGGNFDQTGDNVQRAGVKAQNALDGTKDAIGRIVIAMTPLIEHLGEVANRIAKIANFASKIPTFGRGGRFLGAAYDVWSTTNPIGMGGRAIEAIADGAPGYMQGNRQLTGGNWGGRATTILADQAAEGLAEQQQQRDRLDWKNASAGQWAGRGSVADPLMNDGFDPKKYVQEIDQDATRLILRTIRHKVENAVGSVAKGLDGEAKKRGGGRRKFDDSVPEGFLGGIWGDGAEAIDVFRASLAADRSVTTGSASDGLYSQIKGEQRATSNDLATLMKDLEKGLIGKRESKLEAIFGPVSDFDLYATAWQTLEGAVSAGLNAWLDGGKSAGAAAQEFLRAQAKALTGEALMQAGRHTAYGFGSLAIGGPLAGASAAGHFKAAAVWAGVGVLAGGYAKATAPSAGGTANANAAAGIGGGARGNQGGADPVNLTVVMGQMDGDSPRVVGRRVRRNIDRARRYSHGDGVQHG